MQPIFRWGGQYFGFVTNGYLFDAASNYCGWINSDGTVWRSDGRFLGELVGGEYVLLQESNIQSKRERRLQPATPSEPLIRPADREPRTPREGYVDGLAACP
jgi:hypothetical protein